MHRELKDWVEEVARLTEPKDVVWCDGSDEEYRRLVDLQLNQGSLLELNQEAYPGCYLARSHPQDVAGR